MFGALVDLYLLFECHKSIPEDNDISERQQAGLQSAFSKQGRLSSHEPIVHRIANWVLNRVLDD